MYNYSQIKSIYVKNFRNIGEVQLEFEESPIISLIGDNESGKTSIVKAFAVAALHAYPRDQKDFIRDGTNGFGVAIELEDSSLITRIKTPTLNKYTVQLPNGEVYDTNKIDSGLPLPVQQIMALVEEPETKEYLQVRTYEDQLLFVTTAASTNYKVMYDALKVDQLTRAIKLGSREANDLKGIISDNEVSIKTLTNNLREIRIHDLEPLINVRNRIKDQVDVLDKLEKAKSIADKIKANREQLGSLDLIDRHKVKEIDMVEVGKLISANRLLNNKAKLVKLLEINKESDTLEYIDTSMEKKINDVINKRNALNIKTRSAGALVRLADLEGINEYEAQRLNQAMALKNKVVNSQKTYNILDKPCELVEQSEFNIVVKLARLGQMFNRQRMLKEEIKKSETYVKQVEEYLKQCGATVVVCNNCGEQLVLDTEELAHNH